jgi:hypothetical protein
VDLHGLIADEEHMSVAVFFAIAASAGVCSPRSVPDGELARERARSRDARRHVGELVAHHLEARDRLAEGLALAGVRTDSRYASSAIATHWPASISRSCAKFIMIATKPAFSAEEVLHRDAAVLEVSSAVSRRPPAHLLQLLRHREARACRFSITSSETPPWPWPPVRTAVVTKSARARGDERLGAVDDVVIAVAHGARAEARRRRCRRPAR